MILSAENLEAAKRGETVRLAADGVEIVVVRADLFDRVKDVPYDDGDWTEDELRTLAARTFEDADQAGPIE